METKENQRDTQLENEHRSRLRRRAIDQLAIGSIILLWGSPVDTEASWNNREERKHVAFCLNGLRHTARSRWHLQIEQIEKSVRKRFVSKQACDKT